MLLYHGTSTLFLKSILEKGLTTRKENGNNNWSHNPNISPSKENCVYLTNLWGYALFYSSNTTTSEDCFDVIIVVDVDKKDLAMDDDVEIVGKKYIPGFETTGDGSLQVLGTVAYKGTIPVEKFKSIYVILDRRYVMNQMHDGLNPLAFKILSSENANQKKANKWLRKTLMRSKGILVYLKPFKIDFSKFKEVDAFTREIALKYRNLAYPEFSVMHEIADKMNQKLREEDEHAMQ